jgi:hypothetical protein
VQFPASELVSSVGVEAAQRTWNPDGRVIPDRGPTGSISPATLCLVLQGFGQLDHIADPIVNAPEACPFTLVAVAVHVRLTSAGWTPVAVSRIPSLKRHFS